MPSRNVSVYEENIQYFFAKKLHVHRGRVYLLLRSTLHTQYNMKFMMKVINV